MLKHKLSGKSKMRAHKCKYTFTLNILLNNFIATVYNSLTKPFRTYSNNTMDILFNIYLIYDNDIKLFSE